MAKTVEELEAELNTLKSGNEALVAKNKELLDEIKAERRKNTENSGDLQKFYDLQDKYDALKEEQTKLQRDLDKSNKTVNTLTEEKTALEGNLTGLIVDDGLTNQLTKAGVKPEYLEATKALLRSKVSVADNKAVVGEKGLEEFMKEWSTTDGKAFITAPANGGGDANGSNGGGVNEFAKYFDKKSDDYNLTKQGEVYNTDPELYKQLKG